METIAPLANLYEELWQSTAGDQLIKDLNVKESLLFNHIKAGNSINNVIAAKMLYEGGPSSIGFQKFKSNFLPKLIRIVSNYENKTGTDIQKAHIDIYREYYVIKMLFRLGLRSIGITLSHKTLKKAGKYQIYEVCSDLSRLMSSHYLCFEKKQKTGEKYMGLYRKYNECLTLENEAEFRYALLICKSSKQELNSKIATLAGQYKLDLEANLHVDSHKYRMFYYYISIIEKVLRADYKGIYEDSKAALSYYDKLHYDYSSYKNMFRAELINACLHLNEIMEAQSLIKTNIKIYPNASHQWFTNIELLVRLNLQIQSYEDAAETIEKAMSNKKFKFEQKVNRERWWVFKLHADLMLGQLTPKSIKRIKNNLSRLRKDKKGMNVPIMIGLLVNDIIQNGTDEILERYEKLKAYAYNNLNDGNNDRTMIFLKLLFELPEYRYDPEGFKSKSGAILDQLLDKPRAMVTQADCIEVVPYEDLWHMIKVHVVKEKPASEGGIPGEAGDLF